MESISPEQLKAKLDAGKSVFLKLWKKGCMPCKLANPAIERLEAKDASSDSSREWVQIETSDHPEMLEVSGSEVLPAFFIFRDGKMISQTVGFKGIAKLQAFIEEADRTEN